MKVYLNSNLGALSVTQAPLDNATLVNVETVFESAKKKYQEVVSAEVHQDLVFHSDLNVATFNGLTSSSNSEFGIEYCQEHEAHNILSYEAARKIWNLDDNLFPIL